ncbi:MAG: toxin-antitoxin system YwqK family antitoxin [bacterium]|nr:toxin-antitoxin system YwqK family antitoxin [bacterium]
MKRALAYVVLPLAVLVAAWAMLSGDAQDEPEALERTAAVEPARASDEHSADEVDLVPVPEPVRGAEPVEATGAEDEADASAAKREPELRKLDVLGNGSFVRFGEANSVLLSPSMNTDLTMQVSDELFVSGAALTLEWAGEGNLRHLIVKPQTDLEEGFNKTEHADGKTASQGYVTGGLQTGIWTTWYANGKRQSEGSYTYGKKHGTWTTWHEAGEKSTEGEYVYGKREGPWAEYHANGNKSEVANYVNGKRDGRRMNWHVNEKRKSESFYSYGRQHLEFREWYMNGQLAKQGTHEYGKLTGRLRVWQADGSENEGESGVYEDGERVRD